MMEHALNASKHNYQLKLVLIRVYELLGAFSCAVAIYNTMGIKHVQHDTMSHFITDRAVSFGQFNDALSQLYGAHEIYHSNEAEVCERPDESLERSWSAFSVLSLLTLFPFYIDARDDPAGI